MFVSVEGKERISNWKEEEYNLLNGRDPGTLSINLEKASIV